MEEIWAIRLFQYDSKSYAVRITGEGQSVKAQGRTPYEAYHNAEIKLVIKPGFFLADA